MLWCKNGHSGISGMAVFHFLSVNLLYAILSQVTKPWCRGWHLFSRGFYFGELLVLQELKAAGTAMLSVGFTLATDSPTICKWQGCSGLRARSLNYSFSRL